ncbi:MAG: hypothetical protein AAGM67_05420 [Bacteroidota bacterium]
MTPEEAEQIAEEAMENSRRRLEEKATLCIQVSRELLPGVENPAIIEHQALTLMDLPLDTIHMDDLNYRGKIFMLQKDGNFLTCVQCGYPGTTRVEEHVLHYCSRCRSTGKIWR